MQATTFGVIKCTAGCNYYIESYKQINQRELSSTCLCYDKYGIEEHAVKSSTLREENNNFIG